MNDFISLSCPSCGGHLKLDSKTREYTCDYCGTNHRVRNEDVEFYGRCPVCKRNDKVEKVSALIHKQDGLARLFPSPKFPNNYLEFKPRLEPKPLPEPSFEFVPKGKWNKHKILGFSLIVLTIILLISLFNLGERSTFIQIFFSIAFFVGILLSGILLIIGFGTDNRASSIQHAQKIKKWQGDNKKIQEDWENEERIAITKFQDEKEYFTRRYSIGKERFNLLYYCYRDDCIFIPGEDDYTSSANFEEFIYKGMY